MNRFLPYVLGLLACCLASGTAAAYRSVPAPRDPGPVTLELVDRDSGRLLPQAYHRGQAWVAGWPGQSYAIRLHNRGHERLLVVLSVDGVNAVSGQTADPVQAGYVLEPGQLTDITGWRKSMQSVAGFVFVDPQDSYAAQTGRPANVGVIGIAVHREKQVSRPVLWPQRRAAPIAESESGAAAAERSADADMASAPQRARQQIGTGHGGIEASSVRQTEFDRDPRILQLSELRYDTPSALQARGVRMQRPSIPAPFDAPRAFPGGFVPDPPRRR